MAKVRIPGYAVNPATLSPQIRAPITKTPDRQECAATDHPDFLPGRHIESPRGVVVTTEHDFAGKVIFLGRGSVRRSALLPAVCHDLTACLSLSERRCPD